MPFPPSINTMCPLVPETYLSVPTPPASMIRAGPSCRDFPIHLWAKARRMCPWATIKTSPRGSLSSGLPMIGPCQLSRIFLIRRSRRCVTSSGLLRVRASSVSKRASQNAKLKIEDSTEGRGGGERGKGGDDMMKGVL